MFKKHYSIDVYTCYVVLRWFNNFSTNVSWGALLNSKRMDASLMNHIPNAMNNHRAGTKTKAWCQSPFFLRTYNNWYLFWTRLHTSFFFYSCSHVAHALRKAFLFLMWFCMHVSIVAWNKQYRARHCLKSRKGVNVVYKVSDETLFLLIGKPRTFPYQIAPKVICFSYLTR